LSQRGLLDPTKPAYNRSQPDGRLRLTASAFKPPNNAGLHVHTSGLFHTGWLGSYRVMRKGDIREAVNCCMTNYELLR